MLISLSVRLQEIVVGKSPNKWCITSSFFVYDFFYASDKIWWAASTHDHNLIEMNTARHGHLFYKSNIASVV